MKLYCLDCSVKAGELVPLLYSFVGVPLVANSFTMHSPYYCPVCKQDYEFEGDERPTAEKIAEFCLHMVDTYANLYESIMGPPEEEKEEG